MFVTNVFGVISVTEAMLPCCGARRPAGILVSSADPGPCATDFTTAFPDLTRTAADGAAIVIRLATLGADGPSGRHLRDSGSVPW